LQTLPTPSSPRAAGQPPRSTYRLQLGPRLKFADAANLADYLADLGVTHAYLSPILSAGPGSTHGYDVVDPTAINPELGGPRGFATLIKAFKAHGIGVVVDIVPNHLAVPVPETLNHALWEVLKDGEQSAFARWFDIDWKAAGGRIVLPVLDGALTDNLGKLSVSKHRGHQATLHYFDHVFPLAEGTAQLPLEQALEKQHYRLVDWRAATTELNYRRFMDITTLIGVRVEDAEVFAATHATVIDLVNRGVVDGLRIDHPDGLADPAGYLDDLAKATGSIWTVVEKILAKGEALPPDWNTAGTTGYETLTAVNALLVDPDGEATMSRTYTQITDESSDFATVEQESKRYVVQHALTAELSRLAGLFDVRKESEPSAPERERTCEAIVEVLTRLSVYRPFASSSPTIEALDEACRQAAAQRPELADRIDAVRARALDGTEFATRFAQTAAIVYAKGVEDTAFYRYARLLSLNEVGGDPSRFGTGIDDFHAFATRLQHDYPAAMTTLSTHDTKRGEDVRARIAVLSEVGDQWHTAVQRWLPIGEQLGCPDHRTSYFFWQTLVGAWPLDADRAGRYMQKATREAKLATSWLTPNQTYDKAVQRFIQRVFDDDGLLADVGMFVASIEPFAAANSLSQKLIQLTMPGIPDIYQGAELATFPLVDPDNRGPVDYGVRREALQSLLDDKLRVTATALRLRRDHPEWFTSYEPIHATGATARHLVAFMRSSSLITLATRLSARLRRDGGWGDLTLTLPPGNWVDALSGRELAGTEHVVADLFNGGSVALLVPGVSVTS
jgi:(1->4)-alpha-D-glucan 1-alpha-D-glucosylmutase